jgi:hypothetical protein
LFHVLEAKREALTPAPPRPHHAELELPIRVAVLESEAEAEISESAGPGDPESDAVRPSAVKVVTEDTRDKRIIDAEMKMKAYRSSRGQWTKAAPAAIRAYYIWRDNPNLTPENIASLLRDPPLKTYTVNVYILEAIAGENFTYEKARLGKDIARGLRPDFSYGKYRQIIEECQKA